MSGSRGRVEAAHPLAPLTTFRVGGPAGLYMEAGSDQDLMAASRVVRDTGIAHDSSECRTRRSPRLQPRASSRLPLINVG